MRLAVPIPASAHLSTLTGVSAAQPAAVSLPAMAARPRPAMSSTSVGTLERASAAQSVASTSWPVSTVKEGPSCACVKGKPAREGRRRIGGGRS